MASSIEPLENLYYFWTHPLAGNRPEDYACVGPERSMFLVQLVKGFVPQPQSVLEVGCNSGRNLHYLLEAGYDELAGLDILDTSDTVRKYFPDLLGKVRFAWGPAELVLPTVPGCTYDLVFTMATLTHIPPEQTLVVAACMADIARHYIIIIEDEHRGWPLNHGDWARRFFPQGYQGIFEDLGFRQMVELPGLALDKDIDECFTARVFCRREA